MRLAKKKIEFPAKIERSADLEAMRKTARINNEILHPGCSIHSSREYGDSAKAVEIEH
jgi:hypothetical protein